MRFVELIVTDCVEEGEVVTRTEWLHRDHIETIEAYLAGTAAEAMLWLELTLTSGRIRYVPVGAYAGSDVDAAAAEAIQVLLEGPRPVAAAR